MYMYISTWCIPFILIDFIISITKFFDIKIFEFITDKNIDGNFDKNIDIDYRICRYVCRQNYQQIYRYLHNSNNHDSHGIR